LHSLELAVAGDARPQPRRQLDEKIGLLHVVRSG
jgi:hypothetical protein